MVQLREGEVAPLHHATFELASSGDSKTVLCLQVLSGYYLGLTESTQSYGTTVQRSPKTIAQFGLKASEDRALLEYPIFCFEVSNLAGRKSVRITFYLLPRTSTYMSHYNNDLTPLCRLIIGL